MPKNAYSEKDGMKKDLKKRTSMSICLIALLDAGQSRRRPKQIVARRRLSRVDGIKNRRQDLCILNLLKNENPCFGSFLFLSR